MESMDITSPNSHIPESSAPSSVSKVAMDTSRDENSGKSIGPSHTRGRGRGNQRSRGGRDRGGGDRYARGKRPEMGRSEWSQAQGDRRARNEATQAKRRKLDNEKAEKPIYVKDFSKEEIDAEERRPKRKVAVMIGYSGSGYKGMQLNDTEKTIEGDLFEAFVAAGAVSKANANDPKKSSLVRCARTDKGVHAAGNVISMKLIIEDEDIVKRINDNLSPQIRVWGIERTNSSFNCYQLCDSRIYEYLIPTHCFVPPHPESFLGKKLVELADKAGDRERYEERQKDVSTFWSETEEEYIKPILERLDPLIRLLVYQELYHADTDGAKKARKLEAEEGGGSQPVPVKGTDDSDESFQHGNQEQCTKSSKPRELSPVDMAIKELRSAYIKAKKAYRIHPDRLARVKSALSRYIGTQNYHNYTIQKSYRDPSAKRVIKTFVVGEKPVLINDTEWLSLKVHGQSFMMHQIRKMVSMVALVVRCGCHEGRIQDSYNADKIIIPKAPGLGLLLERPVFDSYNQKMRGDHERGPVGFEKYETEMEEFKQREIYERIFREEERDHQFHVMFANLDNIRSPQLLYLSSMGVEATALDPSTAVAAGETLQEAVDGGSSDDDAHAEDG